MVSRTLAGSDWNNSHLVAVDVPRRKRSASRSPGAVQSFGFTEPGRSVKAWGRRVGSLRAAQGCEHGEGHLAILDGGAQDDMLRRLIVRLPADQRQPNDLLRLRRRLLRDPHHVARGIAETRSRADPSVQQVGCGK